MRTHLLLLGLLLAFTARLGADILDDALESYRRKDYAEARSMFEAIVAKEPQNAAACHWLGLTLKRLRDPKLLEPAIDWLKKASELEPENPTYLFEYGGACLQLAAKTRSLSAASTGRDALEKVVKLVPTHTEAHEALLQYYSQAPWPIGSSAKANEHLTAIRSCDPYRADFVEIVWRIDAREYTLAFSKCDEVLARRPDDYGVLLQQARAALLTGRNLDRALENLRHALTLTQPKGMPGPAFVHWRIGNVEEKLGHTDAARASYEKALSVDENFAQARKSLDALQAAPAQKQG